MTEIKEPEVNESVKTPENPEDTLDNKTEHVEKEKEETSHVKLLPNESTDSFILYSDLNGKSGLEKQQEDINLLGESSRGRFLLNLVSW